MLVSPTGVCVYQTPQTVCLKWVCFIVCNVDSYKVYFKKIPILQVDWKLTSTCLLNIISIIREKHIESYWKDVSWWTGKCSSSLNWWRRDKFDAGSENLTKGAMEAGVGRSLRRVPQGGDRSPPPPKSGSPFFLGAHSKVFWGWISNNYHVVGSGHVFHPLKNIFGRMFLSVW